MLARPLSSPPTQPWRRLKSEIAPGTSPVEAAELVLKRCEVVAPPVDVHGIIHRLGIHLVQASNFDWSGAVRSDDTGAWIYCHAEHSNVRQRFTLAHELGHLLLHDVGVAFRDHTFSGNPRETEANRFAAALLIPRRMLLREADGTRTAEVLAGIFQVSAPAMDIELERAGIVSPRLSL